jgi:hypothetical protein
MTVPSQEPLCGIDHCTHLAVTLEVCEAHRAKVTALLGVGGLARLYVELNIALADSGKSDNGPVVSMSKEKSLPINTAARDAQVFILDELSALESAMRRSQQWIPAPRRGREGPRVQAACTVLATHIEVWLSAETASRVLRLGHVARSALGASGPRSNRVVMACPHCDEMALLRRNGTDLIVCGYCAGTVTPQWVDDQLDPPSTREAA